MFEPGQIMCHKTTGELVVVLELVGERGVEVSRPVMSHENGITHVKNAVYTFELETVEEHLRREAKEMVLKTKIQEEMMAELDAGKKSKVENLLIN